MSAGHKTVQCVENFKNSCETYFPAKGAPGGVTGYACPPSRGALLLGLYAFIKFLQICGAEFEAGATFFQLHK